jgi:hypothetical protein
MQTDEENISTSVILLAVVDSAAMKFSPLGYEIGLCKGNL